MDMRTGMDLAYVRKAVSLLVDNLQQRKYA